jgi:hypothetical protein
MAKTKTNENNIIMIIEEPEGGGEDRVISGIIVEHLRKRKTS